MSPQRAYLGMSAFEPYLACHGGMVTSSSVFADAAARRPQRFIRADEARQRELSLQRAQGLARDWHEYLAALEAAGKA